MRPSKQHLFVLITFLVTVCVIESLCLVGGRYLQRVGVFYRPRVIDDYAQYLEARDPLLGWPPPSSFGSGDLDSIGSRITPAFPDPIRQAA